MKELKSRISIFRQTKGLSRRELTKQIGCSYPSMIAYENGEKMPPKRFLIRLCSLFYCQPGDLFYVD